jgi:hypothetical protein
MVVCKNTRVMQQHQQQQQQLHLAASQEWVGGVVKVLTMQ